MQGDPVNFVDPSGLNLSSGGVGPCFLVVRGTHWDYPDGTRVTVVNSRSMHCFGGGGGGGSVSGAPQNTDSKDNHRDDCLAFAAIVDDLARKAKNNVSFIRNLYRQLSGDREGKVYRSRGFAREFTDDVGDGNSPNQVRHATGGIAAGFAGGMTPGATVGLTLDAFNEWDRTYKTTRVPGTLAGNPAYQRVLLPPTPSQAADMRLNAVTVPIGFLLGAGQIDRKIVGELIRKTICNH